MPLLCVCCHSVDETLRRQRSYLFRPGVPALSQILRESFSAVFWGLTGPQQQAGASEPWLEMPRAWWECWLTSRPRSDNVNENGKIVLFAPAAVSLFSRNGEACIMKLGLAAYEYLMKTHSVYFPTWGHMSGKHFEFRHGALTKVLPTRPGNILLASFYNVSHIIEMCVFYWLID